MFIDQLQKEVEEIRVRERLLLGQRRAIENEIRTILSKQFIIDNYITLNDIQVASGDDIPYHGDCSEYGKWLKTNNITKKYCEWNGRLYLTCDMINGQPTQTPAQIEDVPKA